MTSGSRHRLPQPGETGETAAARPAVAVLVKQVPEVADTLMRADGRLDRDAGAAEMNPYCRRALAKGIELAEHMGGTCTAVTLGPPSAEQVLMEALGCGADHAVLITDPLLAGADTLATARALAAALALTGPYELVLAGRNSVDSDTAQVGPQVAELAGMAFVGPAREIHLRDTGLAVRSQLDDGWRESEVAFPAVVTCAERLCRPARLPDPPEPERLRARIRRLTAADLGPGPWGQAGSPTRVERVEAVIRTRRRDVAHALTDEDLDLLLGALADRGPAAPPAQVSDSAAPSGPVIAVLAEPGRARLSRELLGAAADLAAAARARVAVIACGADPDPVEAGTWGADEAVVADGRPSEAALASVLATWCGWRRPEVVLAPGTDWGREAAARLAARVGAGLTGDAIGLSWDEGTLTCLKAVSGGSQVAHIRYLSPVQMATVRPGVFPLRPPRGPRYVPVLRLAAPAGTRPFHTRRDADADADALAAARVVIGVGSGVAAGDYPLLHQLAALLGGQLAATRRVTDAGLLPHYRQVGITGRSIAPDVYLALGMSGKPNHMIGVRRAGFIAAVNSDPAAPVFAAADLSIVADWRDVTQAVIARLAARRSAVGGGQLAAGVTHAR